MRTAALVTACLLWTAAASAESISVSGEALLYVAPDEVIIGLGIETFDPLLARSRAQNDADAKRLVAALERLGIEDKHVKTDTMEVELHYRDGNHPAQGIEGYYVRRAFTVTLKDPALVERTIGSALQNGANRLMRLDFRTTELRRFRDEARVQAVRAAREKAVLLAGELGSKVGRPQQINEGSYGWLGSSRSWGWNGAGANFIQNVSQAGSDSNQDGSTTIPLGQIGVRATVSVVFDLQS